MLAKMLLRLEVPSSGVLSFDGKPIGAESDPREHWRQVQAVFQDPFSAFNQFFTIRSQLKSSFNLFKQKPADSEMEQRVDDALLAVNIKPTKRGEIRSSCRGADQRMLLAHIPSPAPVRSRTSHVDGHVAPASILED